MIAGAREAPDAAVQAEHHECEIPRCDHGRQAFLPHNVPLVLLGLTPLMKAVVDKLTEE